MWFKTVKSSFLEILQTVQKAVSIRTTLPILTGIKFQLKGEKLSLSATDLEISIYSEFEVNTLSEGEIVIPARPLIDVIKNLPEAIVEVKADFQSSQVNITCEKSSYFLKTFSPEDFPKIPESNGSNIDLPSRDFKETIRQVIKSASRDETRPILTGVLVLISKNQCKMVATDSYRLAVKEVEIKTNLKEKFKLIIPARTLDELTKIMSEESETIRLGLLENQIAFKINEIKVFSRLIEGQFPNYQQLLPEKYETRIIAKKEDLISVIKRVSVLSPNSPIRISVLKDKLRFYSSAQDIGEASEELDVKIEGEGVNVAFNPTFLLDGLSCFSEEEVFFELQGETKPALLRAPEQSEFLYLVMPVRVT